MYFNFSAARITCDCSNDGRTDPCAANVLAHGDTAHDADFFARNEAEGAGWLFIERPYQRDLTYAPDHMIELEDGTWVRPVSLIKSYV